MEQVGPILAGAAAVIGVLAKLLAVIVKDRRARIDAQGKLEDALHQTELENVRLEAKIERLSADNERLKAENEQLRRYRGDGRDRRQP